MAQMATSSTDAVDAVLEKLLSARERPGKQVASEHEMRMLCTGRDVFTASPSCSNRGPQARSVRRLRGGKYHAFVTAL